jgi:hypothetical protein
MITRSIGADQLYSTNPKSNPIAGCAFTENGCVFNRNWVCLHQLPLSTRSAHYPIRLSARGWCASKVEVVCESSRVVCG